MKERFDKIYHLIMVCLLRSEIFFFSYFLFSGFVCITKFGYKMSQNFWEILDQRNFG